MGDKVNFMRLKIIDYLSCAIIISIASALLSCQAPNSPVQSEALLGKYRFNEAGGIDSLLLNKDGSYLHKSILSNKQTFESRGIWRYDSIEQKVTFNDFIFYNEKGPVNQPGGVWNSKVYMTSDGEVRLNYSRENGIFYYKTK